MRWSDHAEVAYADRSGGHHDRGYHTAEGLTRSGPGTNHFAPRTRTSHPPRRMRSPVRVAKSSRGRAGCPRLRSRVAPMLREWETADPTPGEAAHQLLGLVEGNLSSVWGDPVTGADLGDADQGDRQQLRFFSGKCCVLGYHVGDSVGDFIIDPPQALLYRSVPGEIGFKDEPAPSAGRRDELIERGHRGDHPVGVVIGRRQGI